MTLAGATSAPVRYSKEIIMQPIRIVAIPTEVAQEVRLTMRAPKYGFPAHKELATEAAPCRHCLRTFEVGKDYGILFTYDRFTGVESLPQPGPVYIHADRCSRYRKSVGGVRAPAKHMEAGDSFWVKRT
jgi:hypothetical protein